MDIVLNPLKRLYYRISDTAYHRHAEPLLACMFFIEAIIYMPADPLLVIYCAQQPHKSMRYATIATIAAVCGGVMSYAIGYFLWSTWGEQIMHNTLLNYVVTPATFNTLCTLYQKHQYVALLIAGILPVPYKAATLTAGFCRLSLIPFIICSAIARSIRIFGLSYLIKLYGERIKQYIDRYFNALVLLKLLIVGYIIVLLLR